nr:MAG TPA: hypothetical protein [Caudoviricetes sp.]
MDFKTAMECRIWIDKKRTTTARLSPKLLQI